jgi:hypothetical protein
MYAAIADAPTSCASCNGWLRRGMAKAQIKGCCVRSSRFRPSRVAITDGNDATATWRRPPLACITDLSSMPDSWSWIASCGFDGPCTRRWRVLPRSRGPKDALAPSGRDDGDRVGDFHHWRSSLLASRDGPSRAPPPSGSPAGRAADRVRIVVQATERGGLAIRDAAGVLSGIAVRIPIFAGQGAGRGSDAGSVAGLQGFRPGRRQRDRRLGECPLTSPFK